jgi:hypothetical protein
MPTVESSDSISDTRRVAIEAKVVAIADDSTMKFVKAVKVDQS